MLTRILSYLFRNNDYQYVAHPAQVLWAILIMATGTMTFVRDGWGWFGFFCFILGLLLGVTIILAINWQHSTRYWEVINENLTIALRLNDPNLRWEILAKLGYKEPPKTIAHVEVTPETKDAGWQMKVNNLPVTPAVMNQIANKVLMSKDLTFSEPKYGRLMPKFRKVSKQWKDKGYLKMNNPKNPRLSFSFTRKGMESIIYPYADEAIRKLIEERDNGKE